MRNESFMGQLRIALARDTPAFSRRNSLAERVESAWGVRQSEDVQPSWDPQEGHSSSDAGAGAAKQNNSRRERESETGPLKDSPPAQGESDPSVDLDRLDADLLTLLPLLESGPKEALEQPKLRELLETVQQVLAGDSRIPSLSHMYGEVMRTTLRRTAERLLTLNASTPEAPRVRAEELDRLLEQCRVLYSRLLASGGYLAHESLDYAAAVNVVSLDSFAFLKKDSADYSQRDLTGHDFSHTDLAGANFRGAVVDDGVFIRSDLKNAVFDGASLIRADFTEAVLAGVTVRHANLLRAVLFRANLRSADLSDTDLSGADLRGADLSTARGLSLQALDGAKVNRETKWPASFAEQVAAATQSTGSGGSSEIEIPPEGALVGARYR